MKTDTEWVLVQRESDFNSPDHSDDVVIWLDEHDFIDEDEPGANSMIVGHGPTPVDAWRHTAEQLKKYLEVAEAQVAKLAGTIGGEGRKS